MPTVIRKVEEWYELRCCLLIAGPAGMVVTRRRCISGSIMRPPARVYRMLNGILPPAVMVPCFLVKVIYFRTSPVCGQNIVEVKNCNIFIRIILQPVIDQPLVEGSGIAGVLRTAHGRCGDHHEQGILVLLAIPKMLRVS